MKKVVYSSGAGGRKKTPEEVRCNRRVTAALGTIESKKKTPGVMKKALVSCGKEKKEQLDCDERKRGSAPRKGGKFVFGGEAIKKSLMGREAT